MIIVHDTFVCKPGNAGKLAKRFKEAMGDKPGVLNIMTDITGQWHRVIIVSQYDDLIAYEKNREEEMKDTKENREMAEQFKDINEMYVSGSREIYKAW